MSREQDTESSAQDELDRGFLTKSTPLFRIVDNINRLVTVG